MPTGAFPRSQGESQSSSSSSDASQRQQQRRYPRSYDSISGLDGTSAVVWSCKKTNGSAVADDVTDMRTFNYTFSFTRLSHSVMKKGPHPYKDLRSDMELYNPLSNIFSSHLFRTNSNVDTYLKCFPKYLDLALHSSGN